MMSATESSTSLCLPREALQLRPARHGAVGVHHLADDAGGEEARQAREIDRALGLPGAHQHAALARAQREDVARARRGRPGLAFGATAARMVVRAVGRGDAGGDAARRLDRDGERGLERRGVVLHHQRQAELADALLGEREADQAARRAWP